MKAGALLPSTVVLALLRLVRGADAHPDDDAVLFDEFSSTAKGVILSRAAARVLADTRTMRDDFRDRALDAVLVDMLRQHARERGVV